MGLSRCFGRRAGPGDFVLAEALEGRCLLAASPVPVGGSAAIVGAELVIEGTRRSDLIEILPVGGKSVRVRVNGLSVTFLKADFETIRVVTGAGDDRVMASKAGTDRPMQIDLGAGNDFADTSFADSTVMGGDGDDQIITHDGKDLLMGGAGERYARQPVQRQGRHRRRDRSLPRSSRRLRQLPGRRRLSRRG